MLGFTNRNKFSYRFHSDMAHVMRELQQFTLVYERNWSCLYTVLWTSYEF